MSELLTTKELAKLLHYRVESIQRLVRAGKIPALRMPDGRKYMFEKSAVLEALKIKTKSKPDNGKFELD